LERVKKSIKNQFPFVSSDHSDSQRAELTSIFPDGLCGLYVHGRPLHVFGDFDTTRSFYGFRTDLAAAVGMYTEKIKPTLHERANEVGILRVTSYSNGQLTERQPIVPRLD
jgi:hypothetical protein